MAYELFYFVCVHYFNLTIIIVVRLLSVSPIEMLMYVMLQTAAPAGHRRRLLRAGEVPGRGRGAAGRVQHARDAGESVQYSTVQYSCGAATARQRRW